MWPSTSRSTAIRDRRPISTGLSHRWRRGRPSRVAAAEDEPQRGVNVRAKRRKGFARASYKAPDLSLAPAQRAQFFYYALCSASGEQTPHVTTREGLYRVRMRSRNPDRSQRATNLRPPGAAELLCQLSGGSEGGDGIFGRHGDGRLDVSQAAARSRRKDRGGSGLLVGEFANDEPIMLAEGQIPGY